MTHKSPREILRISDGLKRPIQKKSKGAGTTCFKKAPWDISVTPWSQKTPSGTSETLQWSQKGNLGRSSVSKPRRSPIGTSETLWRSQKSILQQTFTWWWSQKRHPRKILGLKNHQVERLGLSGGLVTQCFGEIVERLRLSGGLKKATWGDPRRSPSGTSETLRWSQKPHPEEVLGGWDYLA